MSKKILVVDDYDDIREMMTAILGYDGYEVIGAADGYEAVSKAVEEHPDLIFLDIAMPLLDGLQAVAAMRQHSELADVPIIAVTAYQDFYEENALEAGCNEVIRKPLDFDQLKPLVERYMHRRSKAADIRQSAS